MSVTTSAKSTRASTAKLVPMRLLSECSLLWVRNGMDTPVMSNRITSLTQTSSVVLAASIQSFWRCVASVAPGALTAFVE